MNLRLKAHRLFACLIAALVVVLPALGREAAWRKFGREASVCLQQDDFSGAEKNYKEAILQLEKLSPGDRDYNCKLDMCLNLAECYRRENRFADCKQILDNSASAIFNADQKDLLLQARYWRRLSELFLSEHKMHDFTLCQIKCMNLMRRALQHCDRYLTFVFIILYQQKDFDDCDLLVKEIATWKDLSNAEKKEIASWTERRRNELTLGAPPSRRH